jgi:hypothetical protein
MYDPPGFIWAITIAGVIATLAATCAVLYVGAVRAPLGRRRATLLAGGAAVVFGGWFAASADHHGPRPPAGVVRAARGPG